MPLTEEVTALIGDKFTPDQLADMLTPEVTTKLGSTHVIRTKQDDDSYVSSKARELTDAEIGTKMGGIYQLVEDQAKELGYTKKANEKATDFNKRVLSDLKAKADAAGGDDALKMQISTLTENLTQATNEKETAIKEISEKYFKKQVDVELSSEFNQIAIAVPANIKTDADKQTFANEQRELLKLKLLSTYTVKEDNDGNKVFYKGDVLQSSTQDGKALSAKAIIARDCANYIDTTVRTINGAGSSSQGNANGGTFTKREQVYTHLKGQGLEEGTNAFTQAAAKIIKEQGIVE